MSTVDHEIADHLKNRFKSHVFNDLDALEGTKVMVWHSEVLKRIDLLVGASEFAEHHVIRHLFLPAQIKKDTELVLDGNHAFFVIPAQQEAINVIKEALLNKKSGTSYHIRVLARIPTHISDLMHTDEAIVNKYRSFAPWPFFWYPSFGDFFLNSFSSTAPQLFFNDDFETFYLCASALSSLGPVQSIKYKGNTARQVVQNLKLFNQTNCSALFDELVIVDRTMDPLTPFLSQYSFSGILDTLFGIDIKGAINVPREMLDRKTFEINAKGKGDVNIRLSHDVYTELIHLSLSDAVSQIRVVFKNLTSIENAHNNLESVNDYKKFMPSLQKLAKSKERAAEALHLLTIAYCRNAQFEQKDLFEQERVFLRGEGSASQVCPLVEKSLIQGTEEADAVKALRLIILQSLTSPGGLHPKVWNEYQRLLVQSFGPQAATWCVNLEHLGLVRPNNSQKPNQYTEVPTDLRGLKCVVSAEEDKLSNFYSGYVPLLVRHLSNGIISK